MRERARGFGRIGGGRPGHRRGLARRPHAEALEGRALMAIAFAPPSLDVSLGVGVSDVATGDFRGVGRPDIVAAVAASGGSNLAGFGFVIPNAGDGTFGAPAPLSVPPNPQHIAIADFNNDGRADVATSNGPYQAFVDVALSLGDGTFAPPASYAVSGGTGSAIAAADLDGDGFADLIAGTGNNDLSLLFNRGDGTFGPAASLPASSPTTIAPGDFDGDGRTDLAFGQYFVNSVAVSRNRGGGAFSGASATQPTTALVNAAAVGDFNGDGRPDILAAAGTTLNVFLNLGGGTFGPALSRPLTSGAYDLAVGDFDGDGRLDAALAVLGPIQVLPGLGDGRFGPTLLFDDTAPSASTIAAADLTGSGRLDLVYGVGGNVRVMRNASSPPVAGVLGFATTAFTAVAGGGPAAITVARTGGATGPASVRYATAAGTAVAGVDYQDVSGTLEFADGEASRTFSVPILAGPSAPAPGFATVRLTLSQATGGATLGESSALLQIARVAAPGLAIADVAVPPGAGRAVFPVTLAYPVAQAVTVRVETVDGTARAGVDYVPVAVTLTFAPGETTGSVTVPILANPGATPGATFSVVLSGPANATLARPRASATIASGPVAALAVQGATVPAVRNALVTATVAAFSDPNATAPSGPYAAAIDWGDGTPPSAGTVVRAGASYAVTGSHVYAQSGTFAITAAISRDGISSLALGVAVVGPNRIVAEVSGAFSPPAHAQYGDATVATFADLGGPAPAGGYLATIDWGDGSPASPGFVVALGTRPAPEGSAASASGAYAIRGTHRYDAPGTYLVAVTVRGADGAVASARAAITARDADGPRVSGLALDRKHGRIAITLEGATAGAGLDLASLTNAANYRLRKRGGLPGDLVVTGVALSPDRPDGSRKVTLKIRGGRRTLPPGVYLVRIRAGGVADADGVPLDGEFRGRLPSGDGKPGGDFVARIVARREIVRIRRPAPILGDAGPRARRAHPQGPPA